MFADLDSTAIASIAFCFFIGLIAVIVMIIQRAMGNEGAGPMSTSNSRPTNEYRLRRIEEKLDLIMNHLDLKYVPVREPWQDLADNPVNKIAAIKEYRMTHSGSLAEAKQAVEDYMQGQSPGRA